MPVKIFSLNVRMITAFECELNYNLKHIQIWCNRCDHMKTRVKRQNLHFEIPVQAILFRSEIFKAI